VDAVEVAEVEETQPVDHSSRLDLWHGPGMVRVAIDHNTSALEQQRDEFHYLGGAVNPPGYTDRDGKVGR
jgi:hypothetical protein